MIPTARTLEKWWEGEVIDGPFGPIISRRLERLSALLCQVAPSDAFVRVSLARGVDDATDVRIEVEYDGVIESIRWRPAAGNLDTDVSVGARTLAKERSPEVLASREAVLTEAMGDPTRMTLETVGLYISALKTRRRDLRERIEAGDSLGAELAAISDQIAAVSARNNELNTERQARVR